MSGGCDEEGQAHEKGRARLLMLRDTFIGEPDWLKLCVRALGAPAGPMTPAWWQTQTIDRRPFREIFPEVFDGTLDAAGRDPDCYGG